MIVVAVKANRHCVHTATRADGCVRDTVPRAEGGCA